MDQTKLSALIDKYFLGETSLQEEDQLLKLLKERQIPEYQALYVQIKGIRNLRIPNLKLEHKIQEKLTGVSHRFGFKRVLAIAASILLIVSLGLKFGGFSNSNKLSANETESIEQVRNALILISGKFNKGVTQAGKFTKFHNTQLKLRNEE